MSKVCWICGPGSQCQGPDDISLMDCAYLRKEVERLKHDKPLIVQWTKYDQMRLDAYEEVLRLTGVVHALRNRLQDDKQTPMQTEVIQ